MTISLQLEFFAELAEVAGGSLCAWQTKAKTMLDLYQELCAHFGFRFTDNAIKPTCNGEICDWQQSLSDGDVVGFLPPFSGG
jgi:molybdopterin converting factor small subunit